MTSTVRWQQRFQNLDRAIQLLRQPLADGVERLSLLEIALHAWLSERTA